MPSYRHRPSRAHAFSFFINMLFSLGLMLCLLGLIGAVALQLLAASFPGGHVAAAGAWAWDHLSWVIRPLVVCFGGFMVTDALEKEARPY